MSERPKKVARSGIDMARQLHELVTICGADPTRLPEFMDAVEHRTGISFSAPCKRQANVLQGVTMSGSHNDKHR